MIPVEPFVAPAVGTREYNAVKKATKEKPVVTLKEVGFARQVYSVNQYSVEEIIDGDDQRFLECSCAAGTPPIDSETLLPTREASPCYHAAAVLLFIAEEQRREHVSK